MEQVTILLGIAQVEESVQDVEGWDIMHRRVPIQGDVAGVVAMHTMLATVLSESSVISQVEENTSVQIIVEL